ncbi:hypothetical protein EES41_41070 (plasmid) [Streptomyces sp. ADI95-16]|uniref:hypothetical protein n=1 Tax=Streptomyces sp. ADI95-16 TaxID=1522758 RepID=UPI000F42E83F|nr:hypothetical protein [Streptomyces sp. ADI95-16]AYV33172.1 hypothetical protein EES41_41070 [Streptomyces sp. ADI95-16]
MSLTPEQAAAVEAEARRIEQAAADLRDAERRQGEAQADALIAQWNHAQGR